MILYTKTTQNLRDQGIAVVELTQVRKFLIECGIRKRKFSWVEYLMIKEWSCHKEQEKFKCNDRSLFPKHCTWVSHWYVCVLDLWIHARKPVLFCIKSKGIGPDIDFSSLSVSWVYLSFGLPIVETVTFAEYLKGLSDRLKQWKKGALYL